MFLQRWRWVGLALAAFAIIPSLLAEPSSLPGGRLTSRAVIATAGAPIPQPATAHTEKEFTERMNSWRCRAYLESFQQAAKGKPWEKDGQEFVLDTVAEFHARDTGQPPKRWQILADRGNALLNAGCNDCVVRYLTTRCRHLLDSNQQTELSDLQKILGDTERDPNYRKAFAFMVAAHIRDALPNASDFDQKILDVMGQAYEEGSYGGDNDAIFIRQLGEYIDMDKSSGQAEKLVASLGSLSNWARKTILGRVENSRAWQMRTNQATFREGLDRAETLLTEAWRERPDQPFAAAVMIAIAMESQAPRQTIRTWFDRAVSAQFDLRQAYYLYEMALQPAWGGSYDEMIEFGLACAGTKRSETDVPGRFVDIAERVGRETSKLRATFGYAPVADAILASDKGYVASVDRPGNLNLWLYNTMLDAWLCQRWSDGKAAMDRLPDRVPTVGILNRLKRFDLGIDDLRGEIEVFNSPAAVAYGKAREMDLQDRYREAATYYDAAMNATAGSPSVSAFIASMKQINGLRIEFDKAQWTDVSPVFMGDELWRFSKAADITVPQPGILQIVGKGQTTLSTCKMMVGENYELQADFEFLSPAEGRHLFAVALGRSPTFNYVTCQMYFEKNLIGSLNILKEFYNTTNPKYAVYLQQKNHLFIQCWKGAVNLQVNGQTIFHKLISVDGTPSDHFGTIGFGGYRLGADEGYRLSNILIRPLKSDPAEGNAGQ